jgi:RHS repeat-associated protein
MVALAEKYSRETYTPRKRTARNPYRPQNAYPRNFLQAQNRGPARKNRILSTKYLDDSTGWYYYGYRYYSPELGRWPSRDPADEHAFRDLHLDGFGIGSNGASLYAMIGNQLPNAYDFLGLVSCPLNKCDRWKLSINGAAGGGAFAVALGVDGSIVASDRCCMDSYGAGYGYLGFGFGVGLSVSFTASDGSRIFNTPCISLADHEGLGRVSVLGVAAGSLGIGYMYVLTPQTYQDFSGPTTGLDASAATTLGMWSLDTSDLFPFGFSDE